jgi:hypothetical protein
MAIFAFGATSAAIAPSAAPIAERVDCAAENTIGSAASSADPHEVAPIANTTAPMKT